MYGTVGPEDGSGSYSGFSDFSFANAADIFEQFFGGRNPFEMFDEDFGDFGGFGRQRHGKSGGKSHSRGFDPFGGAGFGFGDDFFSSGFGGFGDDFGGGGTSFSSFSSSSMGGGGGISKSTRTQTTYVNGKKVTRTTTTTRYPDGRVETTQDDGDGKVYYINNKTGEKLQQIK